MLTFSPHFDDETPFEILCLGAHSDDIEIGACATIMTIARRYPLAKITWVVFAAADDREVEARESAEFCTKAFAESTFISYQFRDGFFPFEAALIKGKLESLKTKCSPSLVFTHYSSDAHQDHRVISELTKQTFRNNVILEYEVPKFDGDLGSPNFYCLVSDELRQQKLSVLDRFFVSQRSRQWFNDETFSAMLRLRGIECNSSSGYAEGFYCSKIVI